MEFFSYWMDSIQDWWERLTAQRPKTAGAPGTGTRIYVGNLSYSAKNDDLTKLFSKYGKVLSVDIIRDRFSNKPKGYAFVEMPEGDAQRSLALNGTDFLGRKLVVSLAKSKPREPKQENKPRQERQGGGGRGRRGGRGGGGSGEGRQQERPSQEEDREGGERRRGQGPRLFKGKLPDQPRIPRYE